jgi:hypothetical protein
MSLHDHYPGPGWRALHCRLRLNVGEWADLDLSSGRFAMADQLACKSILLAVAICHRWRPVAACLARKLGGGVQNVPTPRRRQYRLRPGC